MIVPALPALSGLLCLALEFLNVHSRSCIYLQQLDPGLPAVVNMGFLRLQIKRTVASQGNPYPQLTVDARVVTAKSSGTITE
jgi:hypothetical protein